MRLFAAICFDEGAAEKFIKIQKDLLKMGKGRFTAEDALHLTLAFLGEIPEDLVPAVRDAMRSVYMQPMSLKIARVGTFSESKGLWWAGIEGNRNLNDLQAGIAAALDNAGVRFQKEKYSPHVTLVRGFVKSSSFDAKKALKKPFEVKADSFCLMRSDLTKDGAVYTAVERYNASL